MAKSKSPTMAALPLSSEPGGQDNDEDDYMNMIIAEPQQPKTKETYTQRRQRKEREAELKRPKSKIEIDRLAAIARETALAQPLHASAPSSKGLKMMQTMGYKAGGTLGAPSAAAHARTEPLHVEPKGDRGGVGLDAEKKRKFREEAEGEAKRVKADEGEYRERVAREREQRRAEGLWWAAMKVAERLDAGESQKEAAEGDDYSSRVQTVVPLPSVPFEYRTLVRSRRVSERERRARHDLYQSLSSGRESYGDDDPEEDADDRLALGREEEEIDEEDEELDAFEASEASERLERVVGWLRDRFWYCFWCKLKYDDEGLEGCPGRREDDHD
ncbi:MAG: hypothetical protein M1825_002833 [Sarcosagium campestre]|nr:MAG: hypothetical protein M1825_002833 [Sarcosagium campestre]